MPAIRNKSRLYSGKKKAALYFGHVHWIYIFHCFLHLFSGVWAAWGKLNNEQYQCMQTFPWMGQQVAANHISSLAWYPGNVNHPFQVAMNSPCVMPFALLCYGGFTLDMHGLRMVPLALSVSYGRYFWESISAGMVFLWLQFPYRWTELGGTPLTSPAQWFSGLKVMKIQIFI